MKSFVFPNLLTQIFLSLYLLFGYKKSHEWTENHHRSYKNNSI
jgi:hypothetical protein